MGADIELDPDMDMEVLPWFPWITGRTPNGTALTIQVRQPFPRINADRLDNVGLLDVPGLIRQMALSRAVFHSEADFQHALAWAIRRTMPDAELRLEVPISVGGLAGQQRNAVDILVRARGQVVPIELKYIKAAAEFEVDGERFHLRSHGAQDIGRYDIVKDIQRIERLVAELDAACGYSITLTNDSSYWKPPGRHGTADEAFRIHDGRTLSGEMRWSDAASAGTTRGRTHPLAVTGSYRLIWNDYSVLNGPHGLFRYLLVDVPSTAD